MEHFKCIFSTLLIESFVSTFANNPSSGRKLVTQSQEWFGNSYFVCGIRQVILAFSPVTKKIRNCDCVANYFHNSESLSNTFSKTGLNTCLIGKDLLTSLSVPVYFVNDVEYVPLLKLIKSLVSSSTLKAFI